nr:MAG TPA: hypothetical protein [Caudoviricetes sp.]
MILLRLRKKESRSPSITSHLDREYNTNRNC